MPIQKLNIQIHGEWKIKNYEKDQNLLESDKIIKEFFFVNLKY